MLGGRVLRVFVVAALAVALAAVLSGCFVLRTLNYSDNTVNAGKKTTARVSVQPIVGSGITRAARSFARGGSGPVAERPFFVMFSETDHPLQFRQGTFDAKGVLNDGKQTLVNDPQLAAIVPQTDDCTFLFPGGRPSAARRGALANFKVLRTKRRITVNNPEVRKIVPASLPIKVPRSYQGSGVFIVLLSGSWVDDGDGVPEDPESSDDEIFCTGGSSSTLQIRHRP